jgi:hypothetical protein
MRPRWFSHRPRTLEGVQCTFTRLPGPPFALAPTPDGKHVFASLPAPDASVVGLLAAADPWRVVRVIPMPPPGMPRGLCLDRTGRFLLVSHGHGLTVVEVAAAVAGEDDPVAAVVHEPGAESTLVALSADNRLAFVTNEDADTFSVFDFGETLGGGEPQARLLARLDVSPGPIGVVVTGDGEHVLFTSLRGRGERKGALSSVAVADLFTAGNAATVTTVAAGESPVRVTTSSSGKTVWVTARGSDELLAFDRSSLAHGSGAARASVGVGRAPVGLALAANDSLVLVANSDRYGGSDKPQTLSVVDAGAALAGERAVLGTVATGAFPRDVATLPDGERVLVANFGSRTLQTLSLAKITALQRA